MIEGISAVTLGTHEMPRAVRFYRGLGFEVLHGDEESSFTSLNGMPGLAPGIFIWKTLSKTGIIPA